jgi:hypothetical protein
MRQAQAYSTPLFRKTRTLETKKLFLASRVLSGAHFAWLVSDVSVESPSLDAGEKSWQRNGTTWVYTYGQWIDKWGQQNRQTCDTDLKTHFAVSVANEVYLCRWQLGLGCFCSSSIPTDAHQCRSLDKNRGDELQKCVKVVFSWGRKNYTLELGDR